MRDLYTDMLGRTEPPSGHYVGNLRIGSVVRWDLNRERWAKVVGQSPGGTTVSIKSGVRAFTPRTGSSAGVPVLISSRDSIVIARGTIVWRRGEGIGETGDDWATDTEDEDVPDADDFSWLSLYEPEEVPEWTHAEILNDPDAAELHARSVAEREDDDAS